MYTYIRTYIHVYIYIFIYIYIHIYIHITHIHICIYTFIANGDSTTVYNNIPMYIVINFQPRGICNIAPFGSRPRTAGSQQNKCNAEARLRLNTEPIINTGSTLTVHRERLIHRLSAVGLLRSLRAGSCGPYK